MIDIRSIVACGVLACTTAVSSAQTLEDRPAAPIIFGRASFTPAVTLSNLGIDTNVFSTDTDRKSDFTFTVRPRLDGLLDLGRVQLVVKGGADYIYFRKYAEERSLRPVGSGRIELKITPRSSAHFQEDTTFTRDAVNGEIDRRVSWMEMRSTAGVSLGVTRRITVKASVWDDRTIFDRGDIFHGVALDQTLNRDTRSVDGSVEYAATSVTSAVLSTRVWQDTFANMPSRNETASEYLAGVAFKPRALLAGHATVGFRVSSPSDGVTPTFTGGIVAVDLQYTLHDATQFGFLYDHTSEYSYDPLYPYYRLDRYGGIVRRHIFGPTEAAAGAELERRGYQPLIASPAAVDLNDSTIRYHALIDIRVLRRARIGVEANDVVQLRGQLVPAEYEGLRVGVMASYGIFAVGDRVAPR